MSDERRVGPFLLEGELGRGGMSVVHRARGPDGAAVALKLLGGEAHAAALSGCARERCLQAELGAEAGFVPLLGAGVERGQAWLAMPLLTGGSLRDRLRRGPLPAQEGLRLVSALARATARAHARGIVHRDLKARERAVRRRGGPVRGRPGAGQALPARRRCGRQRGADRLGDRHGHLRPGRAPLGVRPGGDHRRAGGWG